jgi:hypothetical protein
MWLIYKYTGMSNMNHDGEMAWICCKWSTNVMKELGACETWHGIMWLYGEDQETSFACDGPGCKCEGQVKDFGAMDRVTMKFEQGVGPCELRQWWRACKVAVVEPVKPHGNMKWIISFMENDGGTSWYGQWSKIVWLATSMDDHCSSFDEDGMDVQGECMIYACECGIYPSIDGCPLTLCHAALGYEYRYGYR